jgi:hypothetical protein
VALIALTKKQKRWAETWFPPSVVMICKLALRQVTGNS